MQRKLFSLCVELLCLLPTTAMAECYEYSYGTGTPVINKIFDSSACKSIVDVYYGDDPSSGPKYTVKTCLTCNDSYRLGEAQSVFLTANCTATYRTCEYCAPCSNCETGAWYTYSTGVEAQHTATCNCGSCVRGMAYRCAAGYYGNGTTCTRCPPEEGINGTSTAGSTARSSCYMPKNTKFNNNTGTGEWTGNSYYCN